MYRETTDKRCQVSQALLYAALAKLAGEKNYSEISITELCQAAGVGRRTFYRLYENKDDILYQKCGVLSAELLGMFKNRVTNGLHGDMVNLFEYWGANDDYIRLLIAAEKTEILHQSLYVFTDKTREYIGKYGQDVDLDRYFDYFAAMESSLWASAIITWIKNDKNISAKKMSEIFLKSIRHILYISFDTSGAD